MAELDAMKELVAQLKAGAAGAGPGASMKGAGEWSCACCRGSLDNRNLHMDMCEDSGIT
jgi:hypothetical protein